MEEAPVALTPSSPPETHAATFKTIASAKPRNIFLPETGITLTKLPPIADKVDLLPKYPTAPLLRETPPRIYPRGSYPPAVAAVKKAAKEPKFVPYEPYKGAVKPFVGTSSSSKLASSTRRKSSAEQKAAAAPHRQLSVAEEDSDGEGDEERRVELEQNYRAMLEAKEKEIERLRQSLQAAEKQLKIQTQVRVQ